MITNYLVLQINLLFFEKSVKENIDVDLNAIYAVLFQFYFKVLADHCEPGDPFCQTRGLSVQPASRIRRCVMTKGGL